MIGNQTDINYLKDASDQLTKLDLNFRMDSLSVEVVWFRVMEKYEAQWVIEKHNHGSYELHLIREGMCEVILDDTSFIVSAGEFYLTKPGVFHEQRSVTHTHLIEYCLNFNLVIHDELDEEANAIDNILKDSVCCPIKDTQGLLSVFTDALIEAKQQKLGYFNQIKSDVYSLIVKLARQIGSVKPQTYAVPIKYRTEEYRIKEIQQFIEQNYSRDLKTSDIANYVNLSEKQVCRIIKKQLNLTTKQLINDVKLKHAKRLLKNQDLSVKQVAYLLGFSSEYYFNQFFKSMEGCPPGRYHETF